MSADLLPHEFAAAGADCRHCRMPWSRVGPEECSGRLRAALDGRAEVPRHLRIAIANAQRAFRADDIGALATINEDIQQLADEAVGYARRRTEAAEAESKAARSNLATLQALYGSEYGPARAALAGLLAEARAAGREEMRAAVVGPDDARWRSVFGLDLTFKGKVGDYARRVREAVKALVVNGGPDAR